MLKNIKKYKIYLISLVCICFLYVACKKLYRSYIETDEKIMSLYARDINLRYWYLNVSTQADEHHGFYNTIRLIKLFKALPRDFELFFLLVVTYYDFDGYRYTYNKWSDFFLMNEDGTMKEETKKHLMNSSPVFSRDLFYALEKVIPKDILYDKLVSMGVGGVWDCETTGELAIFLQDSIKDNPENLKHFIAALEKKTDREVLSFWVFFYDGPHPGHPLNKEYYADIYPKLPTRLAKLMEEAYTWLCTEQPHCCGH